MTITDSTSDDRDEKKTSLRPGGEVIGMVTLHSTLTMETARDDKYVLRAHQRNNNNNILDNSHARSNGFTLRPITAGLPGNEQNARKGEQTSLPKMATNERRPITAMPKIGQGGLIQTPRVPMINNYVNGNASNGSGSARSTSKRRRSRNSSDGDSKLTAINRPRRSSVMSDRKARKVASELAASDDTTEVEYDPHEAWNAFVKYVQSIHVTPTYVSSKTDKTSTPESRNGDYGLVKECKTSSVFRKAFEDVKKKTQKTSRMSYLRNLVSMKNITDMKTKTTEEDEATAEHTDSDADSADEFDCGNGRMNYGPIGWSIIRSYVREKIMERKEKNKNGAGFNWTVLRQQLLAMTNMERHRQDLYTRYGIIPPVGSRVARSSMVVEVSSEAKEVLDKYKLPVAKPSSASAVR